MPQLREAKDLAAKRQKSQMQEVQMLSASDLHMSMQQTAWQEKAQADRNKTRYLTYLFKKHSKTGRFGQKKLEDEVNSLAREIEVQTNEDEKAPFNPFAGVASWESVMPEELPPELGGPGAIEMEEEEVREERLDEDEDVVPMNDSEDEIQMDDGGDEEMNHVPVHVEDGVVRNEGEPLNEQGEVGGGGQPIPQQGEHQGAEGQNLVANEEQGQNQVANEEQGQNQGQNVAQEQQAQEPVRIAPIEPADAIARRNLEGILQNVSSAEMYSGQVDVDAPRLSTNKKKLQRAYKERIYREMELASENDFEKDEYTQEARRAELARLIQQRKNEEIQIPEEIQRQIATIPEFEGRQELVAAYEEKIKRQLLIQKLAKEAAERNDADAEFTPDVVEEGMPFTDTTEYELTVAVSKPSYIFADFEKEKRERKSIYEKALKGLEPGAIADTKKTLDDAVFNTIIKNTPEYKAIEEEGQTQARELQVEYDPASDVNLMAYINAAKAGVNRDPGRSYLYFTNYGRRNDELKKQSEYSFHFEPVTKFEEGNQYQGITEGRVVNPSPLKAESDAVKTTAKIRFTNLANAVAKIRGIKGSGRTYSFLGYNDTSFVIEVAQAAGLNIADKSASIDIKTNYSRSHRIDSADLLAKYLRNVNERGQARTESELLDINLQGNAVSAMDRDESMTQISEIKENARTNRELLTFRGNQLENLTENSILRENVAGPALGAARNKNRENLLKLNFFKALFRFQSHAVHAGNDAQQGQQGNAQAVSFDVQIYDSIVKSVRAKVADKIAALDTEYADLLSDDPSRREKAIKENKTPVAFRRAEAAIVYEALHVKSAERYIEYACRDNHFFAEALFLDHKENEEKYIDHFLSLMPQSEVQDTVSKDKLTPVLDRIIALDEDAASLNWDTDKKKTVRDSLITQIVQKKDTARTSYIDKLKGLKEATPEGKMAMLLYLYQQEWVEDRAQNDPSVVLKRGYYSDDAKRERADLAVQLLQAETDGVQSLVTLRELANQGYRIEGIEADKKEEADKKGADAPEAVVNVQGENPQNKEENKENVEKVKKEKAVKEEASLSEELKTMSLSEAKKANKAPSEMSAQLVKKFTEDKTKGQYADNAFLEAAKNYIQTQTRLVLPDSMITIDYMSFAFAYLAEKKQNFKKLFDGLIADQISGDIGMKDDKIDWKTFFTKISTTWKEAMNAILKSISAKEKPQEQQQGQQQAEGE